ncbi:MAG TPA: hypothetical protein PKX92_08110 [Edaphocola sp.]|nr:hypothetical protein [Edaphocola sp.]
MKHFSLPIIILMGFGLSSCGSTQEDRLYGTWKQVQPSYKQEQVQSAFERNKKAIENMVNVPEDLVDLYATKNLDTLKQRMLAELNFQYQLEEQYAYKFSKDGFVYLINEKNGVEKKLYKFDIIDGDLSLSLFEDTLDFTGSIFEEGSSLVIGFSSKDSLILIDFAGTMSDTTYFKRTN